MTAKNDLLEGLGVGKTYDDLGGIGICYADLYSLLKGIGTGVENIYNELDGIGKGTAYDELGSIGQGKGASELMGLAFGDVSGSIGYPFTNEEITDPKLTSGFLYNYITVKYNYNFASNKYQASITKQNGRSIALFGKIEKTFELEFVQYTTLANKIIDELIYTYSMPEIKLIFKNNLKTMFLEEGDKITISLDGGLSPEGEFVNEEADIIKKNISDIEIEYTCMLTKYNKKNAKGELVNITNTISTKGGLAYNLTYNGTTLSIGVFDSTKTSSVIEGASVIINTNVSITNVNGIAYFALGSGTYSATIKATSYEDLIFTFTI
jgi:hypothetical protein